MGPCLSALWLLAYHGSALRGWAYLDGQRGSRCPLAAPTNAGMGPAGNEHRAGRPRSRRPYHDQHLQDEAPAESRSIVDTYGLAAAIENRLRERGLPVHGIDGPRGQLQVSSYATSDADGSDLSVSMTLSIWEEVELRRAPGAILKVPTWS
jgi:hypothetical protein